MAGCGGIPWFGDRDSVLSVHLRILFYLYIFEGSVTVSAWLPFSEPRNRFVRFALVLILPQITAVCLACGLHPILSCERGHENITVRLSVTEHGLVVQPMNGGGGATDSPTAQVIAWPKLCEVARDARYLYLMQTPVRGQIVPLAAFESAEDTEAFLHTLTFYWQRRYGCVRLTNAARVQS